MKDSDVITAIEVDGVRMEFPGDLSELSDTELVNKFDDLAEFYVDGTMGVVPPGQVHAILCRLMRELALRSLDFDEGETDD